jgi:hypothetical protein
LIFSIAFGIVNVAFVSVEQIGEAMALNMDVLTYMFICLNGRIGFVPFVLQMKDEKFRQERMID